MSLIACAKKSPACVHNCVSAKETPPRHPSVPLLRRRRFPSSPTPRRSTPRSAAAHKLVTPGMGGVPSLPPTPSGSSPSRPPTVARTAEELSSRREGRARSVLEMPPTVVEPVQYRLQKKYCATSHRGVCATAPGVLPKSLFGNQLSAHVLTSHYLHGEPLGRVGERLGLN